MGRRYDRQKMKDELMKRTQESEERREGLSLAKYIDDSIEGLIFAKFGVTKEEPHIVDIIPFYAGKNMPHFMKVPEGKESYYLDIYVHMNIGPGKTWIPCPAENWGEPCPICEHIETLVDEGKEYNDYQEIAPKRRCVYNIVNQTTVKEAKKGVQIWEISHRYSEKLITNAARNPRGGGVVPFAHPDRDTGQSISFTVDNDTYRTVGGYKLVPRDYDISDDILDQAFTLDEIVKTYSYSEIEKIFFRPESEEEKPKEEKTSRGRAGSSDQEDKGKEETTGRRGRGGDEDRGKEKDVQDYEPPAETTTESSGRRRRTASADECPDGGAFGIDIDTRKACETCPEATYQRCATKADEEAAEKKRKLEEERKNAAGSGEGIRRRGRG